MTKKEKDYKKLYLASEKKHKRYVLRKAAEKKRVTKLSRDDKVMWKILMYRESRMSWKAIGKRMHRTPEVLRRAAITKYGYHNVGRPAKGHRTPTEIMRERTEALIKREKLKVSYEEYVRQKY